jgi:hypothetical protein
MNSPCPQASKDASEGVRFTPADIVRRRRAEWNGLRADTVEMRHRQIKSQQYTTWDAKNHIAVH